MGTKGSKMTPETEAKAQAFVERLAPLGDVSSRKMFGGFGIFEGGKMFALINSQGEIFLKADDTNRAQFETAGSGQHGRMPYFQIPDEVLDKDDVLYEWAGESIRLSK